MSQERGDFWGYINTYEEFIKVGRTYKVFIFDLYVSREGQLGWAKYDPESYHKPPRPLKGVKADSATIFDISWMFSRIAKNELKRPVPNSLDMLLDNAGQITKILDEIKVYNLLESVGTK